MLSSRAAVRAIFGELTDTLDEINLPLIADEVTSRVKDNPELLATFLEEHLRPMVYEVGFSLLSSQRASASRLAAAARSVASVAAGASTRAPALRGRLLAAPREQRAGFDWLRQPIMLAVGRQIRLETARRHELDLAIEASKRRLSPARQRVAYFGLVREALPDDDQAVGDVLDGAKLSELWSNAGRLVEREDTVNAMAAQRVAEKRGQRAAQPALAAPTPAT